jgi:enterochelin esterase-like enzyme
VGCGRQDRLYEASQSFSDLLKLKGIDHIFYPGEGGHNWTVWIPHLHEILQLLFKV